MSPDESDTHLPSLSQKLADRIDGRPDDLHDSEMIVGNGDIELRSNHPVSVVEYFLATHASEWSEATYTDYSYDLTRFLEYCEYASIDDLSTLSPTHLTGFKQWRGRDENVALATLHGQLANIRVFIRACESIEEQLLVLALGAWGLRPNEVASLTVNQFELSDGEDNRIVFEQRKNGPGEVAVVFGVDILKQRIVDLDGKGWDGYLFLSIRSSSGHITPQTVTSRFKRLADDAGVTVEGATPTAKMGRRFWYTTYNEVVKQMMEGLEGIAADQGSASTEIVSQNSF